MRNLNVFSSRFGKRIATIAVLTVLAAGTLATAASALHTSAHEDHVVGALHQLRDDLQLNTNQLATWNDAERATHTLFVDMGQRHKAALPEAKRVLADPKTDLAVIFGQLDAVRDANKQEEMQVREKWLALDATLDATQHAKVRAKLLAHISSQH